MPGQILQRPPASNCRIFLRPTTRSGPQRGSRSGVFGKARPCRRGVRAPRPLAARQYAPAAVQRLALACIASSLPRRLPRRVSRRKKGTSTFGTFPPSVQLSGGPSWSLSAPPLRFPPPIHRGRRLGRCCVPTGPAPPPVVSQSALPGTRVPPAFCRSLWQSGPGFLQRLRRARRSVYAPMEEGRQVVAGTRSAISCRVSWTRCQSASLSRTPTDGPEGPGFPLSVPGMVLAWESWSFPGTCPTLPRLSRWEIEGSACLCFAPAMQALCRCLSLLCRCEVGAKQVQSRCEASAK